MEYRRLLVPLDGSRLAEVVLPAVIAVATRAKATVVLMHVLEENAQATVHGEKHLLDAAEAAFYIGGVADRLRAEGITVETHVHEAREGDIARSIAEHAEEFAPDLVVLCAHGPGGLKAFISGRVGQQVMQLGTRPILLLQPGPRGEPPAFDLQTVFVPLDGTPEHEGALDSAVPVAKLFGALLHLCYVVPTVGTVSDERLRSAIFMPNAMREILEMTQQRGAEYLAGVAEKCRAEGLAVSSEVLRGSTVDALLKRANKLKADLVVLAGHGRAGLSAFLTGSVGARLAAKTKTPLLLVRAPEERE
jgi:nucleotide-binding universal stress UspA family protein